MEKELRIIISGGGTGGHIFPAVSIANAIIELRPDAEILFVGAEGRMEMQRVPDAGYRIIGLPIAGFDRKYLWKNVSVLIKLMRSQWKARKVIKNFRPQVAVLFLQIFFAVHLIVFVVKCVGKNCKQDGQCRQALLSIDDIGIAVLFILDKDDAAQKEIFCVLCLEKSI